MTQEGRHDQERTARPTHRTPGMMTAWMGEPDTDTVRGGGGSDTMVDDVSEVDEAYTFWAEWVDAV